MLKAKGGFEINNASDFGKLMDKFSSDAEALKSAGDAAGTFVASLSGATDKVLAKVKL